jgi:hypothetical protein
MSSRRPGSTPTDRRPILATEERPGGLLLADSITEAAGPGGDTCGGRVVVCGSHGGASSARYAIAARAALTVFNDAGVGKDGAGIAALAMLQTEGLAAATVAHSSARIGDARSTLDDGIVSHVNASAAALGLRPGQRLREVLATSP